MSKYFYIKIKLIAKKYKTNLLNNPKGCYFIKGKSIPSKKISS